MKNNKMTNVSYTMAFMLLRIWLGLRALFTGLCKFHGTKEVVIEGADKGLTPEEVAEMKAMAEAGLINDESKVTEAVQALSFDFYTPIDKTGSMSIESFTANPLMPELMIKPYAYVLGFALIGLGITLLSGICTRVTLFLMGLLYISLTYGFIILEPTLGSASAAGIAYLGVHMIMIVGALLLANHNKFELVPCSLLQKICPVKCTNKCADKCADKCEAKED